MASALCMLFVLSFLFPTQMRATTTQLPRRRRRRTSAAHTAGCLIVSLIFDKERRCESASRKHGLTVGAAIAVCVKPTVCKNRGIAVAVVGCRGIVRLLAVVTYPSIHGTSPSYLQSCFTRVSDMTSRRRLRSSTSHRLDVPPVRLSTVDRRAFPVSGATVWHDLPLHVASAPSLAVYKRLETFLFSRSYQDTII